MSSPTTVDGTRAAIVDFMTSRAHVYDLLSRCFETEITAAFADDLARGFDFDSDDETLCAELEAMRESVRDLNEQGLEQLAVVFDRVFFGMGPRTAQKAFPYESVYTSDRGIMMQEAYSQVTNVYRTMNLRKDERFTEPEDHLAVELAFMALLSQQTARRLADGDERAATDLAARQLAFANDHLLNWLPRFCADLRTGAESGFYYHLARFLERFVASDRDALQDMIVED